MEYYEDKKGQNGILRRQKRSEWYIKFMSSQKCVPSLVPGEARNDQPKDAKRECF